MQLTINEFRQAMNGQNCVSYLYEVLGMNNEAIIQQSANHIILEFNDDRQGLYIHDCSRMYVTHSIAYENVQEIQKTVIANKTKYTLICGTSRIVLFMEF